MGRANIEAIKAIISIDSGKMLSINEEFPSIQIIAVISALEKELVVSSSTLKLIHQIFYALLHLITET